ATTRQSASTQNGTPKPNLSAADPLVNLERIAKTPADRLRETMVAGELEGAQAALERLKRIDIVLSAGLRADADALRTIYTRGPGALSQTERQQLRERHGWFGP